LDWVGFPSDRTRVTSNRESLVGSEGCNVLGRVRAIVTSHVVRANLGVDVEGQLNKVSSRVRALSQSKVEPSFFREVALKSFGSTTGDILRAVIVIVRSSESVVSVNVEVVRGVDNLEGNPSSVLVDPDSVVRIGSGEVDGGRERSGGDGISDCFALSVRGGGSGEVILVCGNLSRGTAGVDCNNNGVGARFSFKGISSDGNVEPRINSDSKGIRVRVSQSVISDGGR